jgi:hypothetical protein
MKGKGHRHLPPEKKSSKETKAKPREFSGSLAEQDAQRSAKELKQQSLPGASATPHNAFVRNRYIIANFVKAHLERDKSDKPFISFEFSFPLHEEHEAPKILPKRILEAWKVLVDAHLDKLAFRGVPPQVIELALAPDMQSREGALELPFTEITHAHIDAIEEKGSGKSKEVIRLTFRAKCELDNENMRFARQHFGHTLWVKFVDEVQGSLLDQHDDEEAA